MITDKKRAHLAALKKCNPKRIQQVLVMYAQGRSLEEIAQFHNWTRERVRQMVAKGIRVAVIAAQRQARLAHHSLCPCSTRPIV